MTTEVEIFKKYKPAEDGWISNTKFRRAIHEAYSAGKADGVYLLDKALAIDSIKLSEAYEQQLRDAYKERKSHAPSIYDEAERQVLGEIIDIKGMSKAEMIARIKNPKQKVMTTMGSMYEILQDMVKDSNKAIFEALDKYKNYETTISGTDTLSYKTDGVVISLHDYQLLKLKYLKAKQP